MRLEWAGPPACRFPSGDGKPSMDVARVVDRVIARFIGTKHERDLKKLEPLVDAMNAQEPEVQVLSDEKLTERFAALRTQVQEQLKDADPAEPTYKDELQKALTDAIVPAFALVREAGRRFLKMRHFDVQLIGGMVLNDGKIAEMKTGEGKTLVPTLAAALNALSGRGVHIVTVNDYLARRDPQWMGPVYHFLGLSVGMITHDASYVFEPGYPTTDERLINLRPVERREAYALYKRDRDYIVKDGEIIIVDEFTGRQMPGRRWSEGLHQAIEAKEGLRVQRESVTLATITFQNYFRTYAKLAGMTGTAMTEAEELHKIYKLEVVAIPTHRPMVREDMPDLVYRNEKGKFNALIDEIVELTAEGRPVLVGTVS